MGIAAQVITGRVTNPSTTFTALTPNLGDSFSVLNFSGTAGAYLENAWASEASAGVLRIKSPRMHDQAQGLRMQVGDTIPRLLMPSGARQAMYPSDALTVEMTGGAAETDLGALLLTYDDLPGISANLAAWSEVQGKIKNLVGVEVDATTSATAGQWSGGRALNADFNTLKAQANYAVLGYQTATKCGVVALSGPATGNLKIGGPGPLDCIETRQYFVDMADMSGKPFIPIINGSDSGATQVYVADPATSAAVHVSLIIAELSA